MLKFWSFVYRLTGWYSPAARLAEYNHIKSKFSVIERHFLDSEMDLDDVIGLEVGLWQAKHGFTRRWKRKRK